MRAFLTALQFLTIIRLKNNLALKARDLGGSMLFFPLVGLVLGGLQGAFYALTRMFLPAGAAVMLTVALGVFLTRGLHLDGLSDTLDGIGGGQGREEALRIMKDSHTGAFGVVGLILDLMGRVIFLWDLPPYLAGAALVLSPVCSRFSAVLMTALSPYARPEGGLGAPYVQGLEKRTVVLAGLFAVIPCLVWRPVEGAGVFALSVLTALTAGWYFQKRLGGVTGDTFGALIEGTELLALLYFLVLSYN